MEDGGVPMLLAEKSEPLKRSITASKLAALRFSWWTISGLSDWSFGGSLKSLGTLVAVKRGAALVMASPAGHITPSISLNYASSSGE